MGTPLNSNARTMPQLRAALAAIQLQADELVSLTDPLDVTHGGTNAANAADARTNLGVEIGVDVQAYDAELAALAGLTSAADKLPYFTGSETADVADFSSFGRSLVDDANAATAQATLSLVPDTDVPSEASFTSLSLTVSSNSGDIITNADNINLINIELATYGDIVTHDASEFQPIDADLTALAGLTSAADKLPYFTGAATAAVADFSAFGRSLIDDAAAANARETLDIATGATDNALLRADGTGGYTLQGSAVTVNDDGDILPTSGSAQDIGASGNRFDAVWCEGITVWDGVGYQNAFAPGRIVLRDANNNVILGDPTTGEDITTGISNFLIGVSAGRNITDGDGNVVYGTNALRDSTTADNQTAIGRQALLQNNGSETVGIGKDAGRTCTAATYSTFLGNASGYNASQAATVAYATAVGYGAYVTGDNAVALGYGAAAGANTVVLGNTSHTDTYLFGDVNPEDGADVVLGTSTGTKVGTSASQKLGLWAATPIVQPSGANQAALTNNTGGASDGALAAVAGSGDDATINNNFTDIFTLLDEIRTVLVNIGAMKGSA